MTKPYAPNPTPHFSRSGHRLTTMLAGAFLAALLLLLTCVPAMAASSKSKYTTYQGVQYDKVYDYEYYTTKNKYGKKYRGKPAAAIEHFVTVGMKKQQQGIASFDVKSYRYGSPGLRKWYGKDYAKYYLHYQTKGCKKAKFRKRATGITEMQGAVTQYGKIDLAAIYDYTYYVKRYPSVLDTVGDDEHDVLKHFVTKGLKKNRYGKDPKVYKKAAPTSKTYQKLKAKITNTNAYDGTGLIVCIDPGHQLHGMSAKEPIGPGSSTLKAKVTSGAYGHWSHKNEYEINLEVSLKLRDELEARGYTVVMTRTKHDVQISNIERATLANNAGADIMIRIHANDISASSMNGVFSYVAASNNPYLSSKVITRGQRLGRLLMDAQATATGQRKDTMMYANDMTGINWAKMPCAIVEMGYMSNPTEDLHLANSAFQLKIANGLANGVDQYFKEIIG